MAWIYLIIAGILEVVWALGMKRTEGFTKLGPSLFTIGFMIVSFYLLALAMRSLPAGTSYAVWTGIGAAGTVIFGMIYLGEPRDLGRILCVALILSGVIGLKVLSKSAA
jgi:quaternary ammonium compound-resistance protein SugE